MKQQKSTEDKAAAHAQVLGEANAFGDEPTQRDRPWPGDAVAAFHRALLSVRIKCNELATALAEGYPVDIEIAASHLTSAWFAATAAVKTLHARTHDAEAQERAALQLLSDSQKVLVELFDRSVIAPSPVADLPRLREILCRLSATITTTTIQRSD